MLYLGSSLKVWFLEAVLRDERDGVVGDYLMDETELDTRQYAEAEVREVLKLIDLRGDGPVRMGVPSDVPRGPNQILARKWSVAFHEHPAQADGIIYPSRLNVSVRSRHFEAYSGRGGLHGRRVWLRRPSHVRSFQDRIADPRGTRGCRLPKSVCL